MNKLKLFIENFLVYGVGGIISKIIPLIMIPIITHIMPIPDFVGLNDLSNTVISFARAFAVMGIYDAMYRMFFEKDEDRFKKKVCSTALGFTVVMSAVVFVILLLMKDIIADWFFNDRAYFFLVYLCAIATLVGATNSIIAAPTRMQNKKKIFLIANTISPILSYAISIPLLLAGYYIIALPLASIVSAFTMEITFAVLNNKWFSIKFFDPKLLKQLLIIGIPLMPNFLVYWIFNSSDKLMITNMIGLGAAGIYSVGSKLGHASQLIYTAFSGGWQFFAFSTMKEKDQVKSNSLIFEYLGVISFSATLFVCALSYPIFDILFPDEYLPGYIIAPYLFLAPLIQMLYQVIANQFIVVKKTWPTLIILSAGAGTNVLLNLLLIPVIGIEGASVATLAGYILTDIICSVVLIKMKLLVISGRFLVSTALTTGIMLMWRLLFPDNVWLGLVAAAGASAVFVILYKKELSSLKSGMKNRKHSKTADNTK